MKAVRITPNEATDMSAQARRAEAIAKAEREIDRYVYALSPPSPRLWPAGTLTPEEIKIVEGSTTPGK